MTPAAARQRLVLASGSPRRREMLARLGASFVVRPVAIDESKELAQVSESGELDKWCQDAIDSNPGPADDYRKGKENAVNFLKGQVMKASRGKANPQVVGETLAKLLKG